MVNPCKFYQTDSCKFGNKCRFDHVKIDDTRREPPRNSYNDSRNDTRRDQGNPFGQPSRNPFDNALHQSEPRGYNQPSRGGQSQGRGNDRRTPDSRAGPQDGRFYINEDATRTELMNERPEWPLSCYTGAGNATDSPRHLISGEIESSPEEVRTAYYLAKLNNQESQAQQSEYAAAQAANSEFQKVLTNLKAAILYAVSGKKESGSRWAIVDECNKQTPSQERGIFAKDSRRANLPTPALGGGFGASSAVTQSTGFGQPSAPTQPSSFGAPSARNRPSGFGAPSALTQPSGFGQPSQVGQTPAFGRPSAPGGFGKPSGAFGQPSALGQTVSAFGNPSPLGAGTAFGQPSNLAQNAFAASRSQVPAFGNTTSFGQATTAKPNPFGQPSSQPVTTAENPFGAPAAQKSPFAPQTPQTPQSNPFSQPSSTPQQTNQSPFGQHGQQTSTPFGQPAQQSSTPFGQPTQLPSSFGQQSNPFGQLSGTFAKPLTPSQQQPSSFGQPSFFKPAQSPQQQTRQPNGFSSTSNQTTQSLPSLNTTHPPLQSGPLTLSPQDGPSRPEDPPEEMFGDKKALFEEKYRHVRERGTFDGGIMPEIAPLHQWVGWGTLEKRFKI